MNSSLKASGGFVPRTFCYIYTRPSTLNIEATRLAGGLDSHGPKVFDWLMK